MNTVMSGPPEVFEAHYVDSRYEFVRLTVRGHNKGEPVQAQVAIMPWERDVLLEELQHHQTLYPRGNDLVDSPMHQLDDLMQEIQQSLQGEPANKDDLVQQLAGMKMAWKVVTGSDWSDVHWSANGYPIKGARSHLKPER